MSELGIFLVVVTVGIIVLRYIFHNPFKYPHFYYDFDVSGKRKVDIADYIDKFLCDKRNWSDIKEYEQKVYKWKQDSRERIRNSILKKHRYKQYLKAVDDENAFKFRTTRDRTYYRQRNYVRTAYVETVTDQTADASWDYIIERFELLSKIDFEATLKEYHCTNQRKLMTPELRKKVMERDNYTCQFCGRYMPDGKNIHIDHIIPVSKGGKTVMSNLQVLCATCNLRKSDKIL